MMKTAYAIAAALLVLGPAVPADEPPPLGDTYQQAMLQEKDQEAGGEPGIIRVDGVPSLAWKPDDNCTLIGSIRAALVALGEPVPLADLMAVSGAAFQVRFYPWCASSSTTEGFAFAEDALAAVGRTAAWLPTSDQDAKERILASLRSDIPVVAQGVVGLPEFGVIAGYDPEPEEWYGRSYYDQDQPKEGYRILERAGSGFLLIGEKTGSALPPEDLVERALLRAVYVMRSGEQGTPHLHGFAALRWWADALRNDAAFERMTEEGAISETVQANESTLAAYRGARQNAIRFLRLHAKLMPDEAAEHANAAADAYEEAAQSILARGYHPFGHGHADPDIAEKSMRDRISRHQMAGLLDIATAREREAVNHLKAILDARREKVLEECRKRAKEHPNDSTAWRHLAEAEFIFGEFSQAAESFHRLADTAPLGNERALAQLHAAICLYQAGKPDKGVDSLLQVPSLLEPKSDFMVGALDRRLAQWEAGRKTYQRFFDALDEYLERTGTEPYSCQFLVARRKWILGDDAGAREVYRKLTEAAPDWVSKKAEKSLQDMKLGLKPVDPLAS